MAERVETHVTERHVHFGAGHGPGVLDFLWDVDLLGKRVAYALSSENEEGWSAIDDLLYDRLMRAELEGT